MWSYITRRYCTVRGLVVEYRTESASCLILFLSRFEFRISFPTLVVDAHRRLPFDVRHCIGHFIFRNGAGPRIHRFRLSLKESASVVHTAKVKVINVHWIIASRQIRFIVESLDQRNRQRKDAPVPSAVDLGGKAKLGSCSTHKHIYTRYTVATLVVTRKCQKFCVWSSSEANHLLEPKEARRPRFFFEHRVSEIFIKSIE